MTDRYAQIRDALAMGPTPGPWDLDMPKRGGWSYISGKGWWDFARVVKVDGRANVEGEANARLIAACDPDTIRELLAERDQLAAALEAARGMVDGCHCATCTCTPGMTPAIRFDTSPAAQEGAIRDHLIALGWTPPGSQQPAAEGANATAALQAEVDALRAEVERLNRLLGRIVACDGDSNLTIRAGTDAFAAAREYLLRDQDGGPSDD